MMALIHSKMPLATEQCYVVHQPIGSIFFAAVRPGSPSLHLVGREALIYGRYVACERIAIHVFLPVR